MARLVALAVLALCHSALGSSVQVLYAPDSILLKDTNQPLASSDYSKFVSLCLAYSTEKPSNFDGFFGYKNFANIPQSVVTFHGPVSLKNIATQNYVLEYNSDSDIENHHSAISSIMISKYENVFSEKVDLFKTEGNTLEVELDSLNSYLSQLLDLKEKNSLPSRLSLWFELDSAEKPGEKSLVNFQQKMQEAVAKIRNLFDEKVVILSIDSHEDSPPLKRTSRQTPKDENPDYNLAYAFDANFHTAFATIGFTTILLLLTVFGVSVAMWNIDPGRDSIIYRLTSQKIKKDQ